MHVRKILTFVDEARSEAGQPAQIPLRKVAAVAVVKNPFAGKFEADLSSLVEASAAVGREITAIALDLLRPYAVGELWQGCDRRPVPASRSTASPCSPPCSATSCATRRAAARPGFPR